MRRHLLVLCFLLVGLSFSAQAQPAKKFLAPESAAHKARPEARRAIGGPSYSSSAPGQGGDALYQAPGQSAGDLYQPVSVGEIGSTYVPPKLLGDGTESMHQPSPIKSGAPKSLYVEPTGKATVGGSLYAPVSR